MRLYAPLLALGLLLAEGCSNNQSVSSLKRNATPNNENVDIVRVKDGGLTRYVLISSDKGFELACSNPIKLKKLIMATGYPFEFLSNSEELQIDSERYINLHVDKQPKIECNNPAGKVLYKADLDQTTKYFFSDSSQARNRLYMIGCQGLMDAMGFALKDAKQLDPALIDDLGIFSVDDQDDISCLEGVSVGAKLRWVSGEDKTVLVQPGQSLPLEVFEATLPTGVSARMQLTERTGDCDWIVPRSLSGSLIISGQPNGNFINKSCKLKVTAELGTILEESKTLTITTDRKQPVLSTTCQTTQKVVETSDFKDCKVTADAGNVQPTYPTELECKDLFSFDSATGTAKLTRLPVTGKVCSISFRADLNGQVSNIIQVAVERQCGVGFIGNGAGGCERIKCDSSHSFGDSWENFHPEIHAYKNYTCQSTGLARDLGFSRCESNDYKRRGDLCLLKCTDTVVEGESRSTTITGGTLTEICSSGRFVGSVSCGSDFNPSGLTCVAKTCEGGYTAGQRKPVTISGGTRYDECKAPQYTYEPVDVTCNSNATRVGLTCSINTVVVQPPPPPERVCNETATKCTDGLKYRCTGGQWKVSDVCSSGGGGSTGPRPI